MGGDVWGSVGRRGNKEEGKEDVKRSEKVDRSNGCRQLVRGNVERSHLQEWSEGVGGNNNRWNTVGCGYSGKIAFGVWICRNMDKLKQSVLPR